MLSAWEVEADLAMCDGGEFSTLPSEWEGVVREVSILF